MKKMDAYSLYMEDVDRIEKYDDEFLSTLLNEEKENPEKAYCTLLLTFLLDTSSDEENEEEDDDDGYLNHNLLFN